MQVAMALKLTPALQVLLASPRSLLHLSFSASCRTRVTQALTVALQARGLHPQHTQRCLFSFLLFSSPFSPWSLGCLL